ncbi:hypothetical protein L484_009811 [Morus notabilis]|uniref:At2g35280-like TPR domain-containing protein n=1 Tax=Morus notabilis TaxID=981085 RepID=W9S4I6_9ROSA|nr:hypothetical protein L484_009811 [Morus notabilis]
MAPTKRTRRRISSTSSPPNTVAKKISKVPQAASSFPICSLLSDLVLEILACVSASSLRDLFSAKLSCKLFKKIAQEDYIYRKISLDDFFVVDIYLNAEATSFFNRCLECGNLEALYQQGLFEYFTDHRRKQSGLALLEKAANSSHLGASYVLGITLICSGDENAQRAGLELVANIKTSLQMQECRKKLAKSAGSLWKPRDVDFLKPKLLTCPFPDRKRSSWHLVGEENGYDHLHCESCILNREIIHVCRMLSGVPLNSYHYRMCLSSDN